MAENRPQGRKKRVTDSSTGVHRRGEGLNTGPVAGKDAHSPTDSLGGGSGKTGKSGVSRAATRAGGGGVSILLILVIAYFLLKGGGLGSLLGNGGMDTGSAGTSSGYTQQVPTQAPSTPKPTQAPAASIANPYANLISGSTSSWTAQTANTQNLNQDVASGAREKYTTILGNNQDTVTIMVYMCGTDLESRNAMATRDLQEMINAKTGNNVTILIYTGGCSRWNNNVVSSTTNQIYLLKNGKLMRAADNIGAKPMTDPATLTEFIQWSARNFPANRNELILWDHGGGSVSGYGYDEKFGRGGSMSLAGIDQALKNAGVKFDFIGFDACLMATMETALMLDDYADYLIASEETEPGIGWYYTNWLTKLGSNSSLPTVQLGQNIVDDFVSTCASQCAGQAATLSVVDLAELAYTAPAPMKAFSESISSLVNSSQYRSVSNARNGSREFARSTAIDQIDLVHFARNLGNREGEQLAQALLGAVKYNRTSSNMSNAYGLSIYFPYRRTSNVDAAVKTYNAIGMDASYSQAIRDFASLEVSGQVASGGSNSAFGSLFDQGYSSSYGSSSDLINGLLSSFLGGDFGSISGLSGSNTDFFSGRSLSTEAMADYIAANSFDAASLYWQRSGDNWVVSLPDEQWEMVEGLALNAFYDDGEGYVDLGYDYLFDFDENGDLLAPTDHTWIAVDGQPVAFYFEYTDGEDFVQGRIPCYLNTVPGTEWTDILGAMEAGETGNASSADDGTVDILVDLIVIFDTEHPYGYIAGARPVYKDGETETVAKNLVTLKEGDVLSFVCDYYRYDGTYDNSYFLGDPMPYYDGMEISNVDVGEGDLLITYRFTDIYQQQYWTNPIIG